MKKISLLLTALFALTAGTVFAQVSISDNADINVSANVIATGLEILEQTPLNFGTVSVETNPSIGINDSNVGVLSISGQPSETVFIQFPVTILLVNGTDQLEVATVAGTGAAGTAVIFTNEESIELDGDGDQNLFIGGTLQAVGGGVIPNGAANGEYTGTGTINIQYNSF